MDTVTITINGRQVDVPPGTTVLNAARQAGIDIPTLCHFPSLIPIGACRLCLVEVKGQRNPQPACTFPVTQGMEVQTDTPRLYEMRKFILSMLFSERNHFCPYCELSGSCELQDLGYRFGLDHFLFETYTKPFPLDASHRHLVIDHNRCVLCARCIRACSEIAANHTLGLGNRGAATLISCDADAPWGESTCVSCGTCAQVCPTGAIIDRRSSYMGRNRQLDRVASACNRCSVVCAMKVAVRGGRVVRIESDWEAPVNGGLLCERGRFEPLHDERERVTEPMIRREGRLMAATWDDALEAAAEKLRGAGGADLGVAVSGDATNEALYTAAKLFREDLGASYLGLLNRNVPKLSGRSGTLADLATSDLVIVVGVDLMKEMPVAAYLSKRAVDKGARLIVVDDGDNGLAPFASLTVPTSDIASAVAAAAAAGRPVVLHGGVTGETAEALKKIADKASFIAMQPGVNAFAATALGFNGDGRAAGTKVLYMILGEQTVGQVIPGQFTIVQAAFRSPAVEGADIVLPSAVWSERAGSLTSTDGRILKADKAVEPAGSAKADWEILALLAQKMGKKSLSFDETSQAALIEIKGKEKA